MELWTTLLLAFGGNAALIAVLAVVAKSFLDKVITRDTLAFEDDLRSRSNSAIERLRSDLALKTTEHQVRFSRLHEKRAVVVADLYGHLVEAFWEAESFLSPMAWVGEASKPEKHQIAMNKLAKLYRFFDKNRIYLPSALCDSLHEAFMEVRKHVINFGVYTRLDDQTMNDHTRKQKEKAWNDGWDAIKNKVPVTRQKLEDEFRALLGALSDR